MGRHLTLGILFFFVLGALGWATIFLGNLNLAPAAELAIDFPEASGLRPGDVVLVAGARAGRVTAVVLKEDDDPDLPVRVFVSLERKIVFRAGYQISIDASTLLGGRVVEIRTGKGAPIPLPGGEVTVLRGRGRADPYADLGDILGENRKDIREIIAGIRSIVTGLDRGEGSLGKVLRDDVLHKRLNTLLTTAEGLLADVRSGKGALGKLLYDEVTATHVASIVENTDTVVAHVAAGKGSLGRLLMSDELADALMTVTGELETTLLAINDEEGTVGYLLHSKELRDRLAASVQNIDEIIAHLRAGKGDIGSLLMNDRVTKEVVQPLGEILADAAKIVRELKEGRGVVGMLLRDDELALLARNAIRSFARSIEDIRESAPISTLVSAIAGAL